MKEQSKLFIKIALVNIISLVIFLGASISWGLCIALNNTLVRYLFVIPALVILVPGSVAITDFVKKLFKL